MRVGKGTVAGALIVLWLAVMIPAAATLVPGGTFVDDDGSFSEPDIEAIAAAGITAGCDTTRYCPDDPVTRAEMAVFLDRALQLPAATASPFIDVGGWYAASVERLAAAGITAGCDTTRYCPDDPVTRGQMATFLRRALGLTPIVPPPRELPAAGNPDGRAPVPAAAGLVDTSSPDTVIGNGTPAGCTSAAVVAAVAAGGVIVFDCGPDPVTIEMTATARVFNDAQPDVVIDGGGMVTLSGGGARRIIYLNTCDPALVWTTSHCDDQDHPRLTVQNLTFVGGNAAGEDLGGGGGAIYARGGRLKVVNSRFFDNRCDPVGPDVGGAAIRAFDQHQDQPVYVVGSTFGAPNHGNVCSNGGAISSIGVSWTVINSLFLANEAVGSGANPARSGTPGGGNGGAIALDGNRFVLTLQGTRIEGNHANEGGGAVFFVSNDRSGNLIIEDSTLTGNPSAGFETAGFPGIFYLGQGPIQVSNSTISP
jgi:hypothetical protein